MDKNPKGRHIQHLQLKVAKGFSHSTPNSILLTEYPRKGIIFFLGSEVCFYDGTDFESIYKNDDNPISAIAIEEEYLAIGEKLLKGQLTTTTVIDLTRRGENSENKVFKFQKTEVTFLSMSLGAEFLCSVGSSNLEKQELVVISVFEKLEFGFKTLIEESYETKKEKIQMITFSKSNPKLLGIVYTNKLSVIQVEKEVKSLRKTAKSSKVREFNMTFFDPMENSCYLCSKNGDITEISLNEMKEVRIGPRKRVIIGGIKHIKYVDPRKAIITGPKGYIGLIELKDMSVVREVTLKEEILSFTEFNEGIGYIATDKAIIYEINALTLSVKQFFACHKGRVNNICFMDGYSEVFASCASDEIVLWKNLNLTPIIKISLQGASCISLNLLRDGTTIVSGWSDGKIRFFNPRTGKKMEEIRDAHYGKVTVLVSSKSSDRLYSGGEDGRIRSWKLEKERFGIIDNIFTGHKSKVHYLKLQEHELYSCSEDGTFAVWNVVKGEKIVMITVSNFLKKIIPYNKYTLYGIGAGPDLLHFAKNDGRILNKIRIGGTYFNDFDVLHNHSEESEVPKNSYFIFGGDTNELILQNLSEFSLEEREEKETCSSLGEITSLSFAPDSNTIIAGTLDGTLLCFEFSADGFVKNESVKLE